MQAQTCGVQKHAEKCWCSPQPPLAGLVALHRAGLGGTVWGAGGPWGSSAPREPLKELSGHGSSANRCLRHFPETNKDGNLLSKVLPGAKPQPRAPKLRHPTNSPLSFPPGRRIPSPVTDPA